MNQLSKYLKPEEIKEIQAKGSEFIDKFEKQLCNPLYREANFHYNRTQLKQMDKAAEKYDNPLNIDEWSADELVDHAFQELVDQSHYITGLGKKYRELQVSYEKLYEQAIYWKEKYQSTLKEGE
jgi:hypothetical protein